MAKEFDEERFKYSALGIKEVLQEIENELIEQRFDEYIVATERGSFVWRTVERARENAEGR